MAVYSLFDVFSYLCALKKIDNEININSLNCKLHHDYQ